MALKKNKEIPMDNALPTFNMVGLDGLLQDLDDRLGALEKGAKPGKDGKDGKDGKRSSAAKVVHWTQKFAAETWDITHNIGNKNVTVNAYDDSDPPKSLDIKSIELYDNRTLLTFEEETGPGQATIVGATCPIEKVSTESPISPSYTIASISEADQSIAVLSMMDEITAGDFVSLSGATAPYDNGVFKVGSVMANFIIVDTSFRAISFDQVDAGGTIQKVEHEETTLPTGSTYVVTSMAADDEDVVTVDGTVTGSLHRGDQITITGAQNSNNNGIYRVKSVRYVNNDLSHVIQMTLDNTSRKLAASQSGWPGTTVTRYANPLTYKILLHFNDAVKPPLDSATPSRYWMEAYGSDDIIFPIDDVFFNSGHYMEIPNGYNFLVTNEGTEPLDIGTGDFTLDFQVKRLAGTGGFFAFRTWGGADWLVANSSGSTDIRLDVGSTYVVFAAPPDNIVTHVAIERYNGLVTVFYDGVIVTTVACTDSLGGSYELFHVGAGSSQVAMVGRMDEFRFCTGAAYRGLPFTPPTAPYSI